MAQAIRDSACSGAFGFTCDVTTGALRLGLEPDRKLACLDSAIGHGLTGAQLAKVYNQGCRRRQVMEQGRAALTRPSRCRAAS